MDPHKIFSIRNQMEFQEAALAVFGFQYANNQVYREFCDYLGKSPAKVQNLSQIPFLPIEFFRSRKVICGNPDVETVFRSSGTGGGEPSRHFIADTDLYEASFNSAFHRFYGKAEEYCILGLLPSYLERGDSSLVYMVDRLIGKSKHPASGFYLDDLERLRNKLIKLEASATKTLLIGVSFALLDLIAEGFLDLKHTIVMETGGMKGRRRELIREELHLLLSRGLGLSRIHSEYGMTELLSQAYSKGQGLFESPPWMQITVRDPEDPFAPMEHGRSGGINVIDLANYYSCSFIATQDLGRTHPDARFEILGRFDNADIRGCNLMVL